VRGKPGWHQNHDGMPTRYRPEGLHGWTTTTEVLNLSAEQHLRMSAMHEAGHAALWSHLGVWLDKVWVRPLAETIELGEREAGGVVAGGRTVIR